MKIIAKMNKNNEKIEKLIQQEIRSAKNSIFYNIKKKEYITILSTEFK